MQFTQDCKNTAHSIPLGIRRLVFFCILFLSSLVVKAQLTPVGAEFSGEWLFDRAEAQEKPMNSTGNYTKRTVSQDEFWQKTHFLNMPTQVVFTGDFFAYISHPSWSNNVVSAINSEGMLEFRLPPEGEGSHDMDLYMVMSPSYSLALNGNTMSLQCDYSYSDAQGKYIEGILTIYYKR